ncbi:MAG: hypothetical protein NTV86_22715 [Planctomycetota bacterium]|nr:hypothetical protein [Planctomycetota bacterium]
MDAAVPGGQPLTAILSCVVGLFCVLLLLASSPAKDSPAPVHAATLPSTETAGMVSGVRPLWRNVRGNYELQAVLGGTFPGPCRILFSSDSRDEAGGRHAFVEISRESLAVGRQMDGRRVVWRTFPGPGSPPWNIRLLKKGNFYTFSANSASGWIRGPMGEWEGHYEPAESFVGVLPPEGAALQICTLTSLPWLQQAGRPVLAHGPAGSHFECQALPGAIIERGGRYYMYFMAGAHGDQEGAARRSIGLATSDDLCHWQPLPAPVLRTADLAYDNIYVNGAVLAPDGRVALMFSAQQFPDWKGFFLATADRPEGPFRLHPGNPVYRYPGPAHEFDLVRADVPEGRYILFFSGFTEHPPTGPAGDRGYLLFSDDLVHWRAHPSNPVFAPQTLAGWDAVHVRPRSLNRIGAWWYLWYEGANTWPPPGVKHHGWWDTVGLARSKDLVHWEHYPRNPALPGLGLSADQFDSNWTGWPRMLIRGNKAYVFYTGNGETGLRTIPVDRLTDWTGEGGETFDMLK